MTGHTPQHATAAQERLAALIEDLEWLLEEGSSHEEIANRLGFKPGTLARRLHRAGRHDLARPFDRIDGLRRLRKCMDCAKPGINKNARRCRDCSNRAIAATRGRAA